jgi:hypothetical protein
MYSCEFFKQMTISRNALLNNCINYFKKCILQLLKKNTLTFVQIDEFHVREENVKTDCLLQFLKRPSFWKSFCVAVEGLGMSLVKSK